jgi:hypothetical protein
MHSREICSLAFAHTSFVRKTRLQTSEATISSVCRVGGLDWLVARQIGVFLQLFFTIRLLKEKRAREPHHVRQPAERRPIGGFLARCAWELANVYPSARSIGATRTRECAFRLLEAHAYLSGSSQTRCTAGIGGIICYSHAQLHLMKRAGEFIHQRHSVMQRRKAPGGGGVGGVWSPRHTVIQNHWRPPDEPSNVSTLVVAMVLRGDPSNFTSMHVPFCFLRG